MIRRIERASGPRFEVYGYRDGKKVFVSSHGTRKEAEDADEDFRVLQRKIERGEMPKHTDARLTFAVAIGKWIEMLKTTPARKGHRSWEDYEAAAERHITPRFGPMPLIEIERDMVIDWRDGLSRESTLSSATINVMLAVMSSACTWFVDRKMIAFNPCSRIEKLETTEVHFPWLQTSEVITRLLSECTPNIRELVAVLVGTGLRLDEALHLRWDDVDLDHRIITVHRGRKGTTKSGKSRRVPIFDSVLVVLKQMKLARGKNTFLWPGGKPGKPLSQPAVRAPFKRALDRAELSPKMRLHDLRHTFASLFLADGGDIFKLSKILGHSTVRITEKIYAHLMPTAYEADYGRVRFAMPSADTVVPLRAA